MAITYNCKKSVVNTGHLVLTKGPNPVCLRLLSGHFGSNTVGQSGVDRRSSSRRMKILDHT